MKRWLWTCARHCNYLYLLRIFDPDFCPPVRCCRFCRQHPVDPDPVGGSAVINRIVVGAHYGLKDWIAQRATAVIMAVYSVVIAAVLIVVRPSTFEAWQGVFANGVIKFFTFLFFVSLFYHAWIGVRDIWMDYVKSTALRLTLHVLTIAALVGYTAWAAAILWRL